VFEVDSLNLGLVYNHSGLGDLRHALTHVACPILTPRLYLRVCALGPDVSSQEAALCHMIDRKRQRNCPGNGSYRIHERASRHLVHGPGQRVA
jgi:hypothetical protein